MNPEMMAQVLAELSKSRAMQRAAWVQVVTDARKYAQLKAHGTYMERGSFCLAHHSSRERMETMFLEELLRSITRAYTEDSLVGAALAEHT